MGHETSTLRTNAPHSAAQAGLQEWHRIVLTRDWEQLLALLVEDVTYHNPAQFEPYRGKDALVGVLRLVFGIFADFEYHRIFSREDGYALEFSARVGDDRLFGVDLVNFNEAGKMTDLVVMLRPAAVVARLGEEAARRMAAAKSQI
ncbi:nuclear transport factor 2 family protein [Bradyrhizobium sp. Pear76]|uniref:nuclear transport factor 2 family protein n=1 Tax=Bradyrhizobium oropedii TaxID=1571201 RepID=UPI001E314666|nr:nuclear transport factor 2 family protein [Bradyrhizobium oropedii]MCC8964764.1 nuclear transport factor 2 family protein [Bradyrhizobium oropedii]